MRKLACLIIAIGLAVLLYPAAARLYDNYMQNKLLAEYESSQTALISGGNAQTGTQDNTEAQPDYTLLNDILSQPEGSPTAQTTQTAAPAPASPALTPKPQASSKSQPTQSAPSKVSAVKADSTAPKIPVPLSLPAIKPAPKAAAAPPDSSPIGIIEIPDIGVKLPILEGVSSAHMKYAAAHMAGTAMPGAIGNSVIAAHRSYTYGRLFSRLDELNVGNTVNLAFQGQTFTYQIYEKKTVAPDDLSVLNYNHKDRVLTLITCNPDGSERVIIHAKLTS